MIPQDAAEILDAGRSYAERPAAGHDRLGRPQDRARQLPARAAAADHSRRASRRPGSSSRLQASQATWKIWGNTIGTPGHARRSAEPAARPRQALARARLRRPCVGGDFGTAYSRARRNLRLRARPRHHRVRDRVRRPPQLLGGPRGQGAAAAGVRAGRASPSSPARSRRRVWSRRSNTLCRRITRCARCSWRTAPHDERPRPTLNMLLRHGVRSCLEYARSCDLEGARRALEPATSPRTSPSSTWAATATRWSRASAAALETEFVCIPRPLERSERDGRRPAALPRAPPRAAVARRRAAAAHHRGARGHRPAVDLSA